MMQRPGLLLLDEPSMGLSPLLVREIFRLIIEINRAGTTILLVEQNAAMALSAAGRAYVLETGEITLRGAASDLRKDPKVRAAYLGEEPR
jgi:branched-chain amino acid transport system ATP-binding protein